MNKIRKLFGWCTRSRTDSETSTNTQFDDIRGDIRPENACSVADSGNSATIPTESQSLSGCGKVESFLLQLYVEIQIKTSPEEFQDIKESVISMVRYLLHKLGILEPQLTSSELIRTGSCFDGTKILEPDEFDFLADLDRFSTSKSTKAYKSCQCPQGYAHLVLEHSTDWLGAEVVNEKNIIKASGSNNSLRETFRRHFHVVLQAEISNDILIKGKTGTLRLEGFAVPINGPQCNVKVLWISNERHDKMSIDIDVTPTVKCADVTTVLDRSDPTNKELYDLLIENHNFYLIPRPNRKCEFCFKMVFADTDQTMVRGLTEPQRKSFMILKYVANKITEHDFTLKRIFNSFALKMATFHQIFTNSKTSDTVHENLVATLQLMLDNLRKDAPSLTSIFITSRNVWRDTTHLECSVTAPEILHKVWSVLTRVKNVGGVLNYHVFHQQLHDACKQSQSLKYCQPMMV